MKNLISTKQLEIKDIYCLFEIADHLDFKDKSLKDQILASLFYEPSTRTRFSFESACLRLGGNVISTENAKEFSSTIKGESLEDTIRVVSHYADIIILRHFKTGAASLAAQFATVPIVNAGDGIGEHPTQAILDLYTIQKGIKRIKQFKIALVGDLKNGRTVHSLIYLLQKFDDIEFYLVSPKELSLPSNFSRQKFKICESLESIIPEIDVLYQTRVQKERFRNIQEYESLKDKYALSDKLVSRMKKNAIIMHPLPRTNEIPTSIDRFPQAIYFSQAAYGIKIRMAILKYLLQRAE